MSNTWKGKNGPLLIAEIGGNHEGNFDYARELTKLAIASNVDYVKYQMYTGDTLVSRIESPQRNKHFKKFELSRDNYIELAELCQQNGVKFMASVWNPEFTSWIDKYIPIYKIGSGDLTAYPVLKQFAKIGKPIIVSTGLSSMDDIKGAIAFIQNQNSIYRDPNYLSILQCTAMYPITYKDANLAVMHSFKKTFGLPVGYSDHTEGTKALEIAVAMGAQILEFHFTDSRENKEFRDHKVSLTKDEVLGLINSIKDIELLKGSSDKQPLAVEGDHKHSFRRAVYPKHDLTKGTIIKEEDIVVLRPNHGIDAREFYEILGKELKVDVKAHQKLIWEYFK